LGRALAADAAAQSTRKRTVLRRVRACSSAIAVIAEKCWNITAGSRLAQRGTTRMSLLIVYVVLVIAGDVVAYLLGLVIEREVPAASLPAFLAMYFLFLWVAWVIAVRITQPKAQPQ
jgi:uncharacterized membrane protein YfcA